MKSVLFVVAMASCMALGACVPPADPVDRVAEGAAGGAGVGAGVGALMSLPIPVFVLPATAVGAIAGAAIGGGMAFFTIPAGAATP